MKNQKLKPTKYNGKLPDNFCLRYKCAKQHWPTKTVIFDTYFEWHSQQNNFAID